MGNQVSKHRGTGWKNWDDKEIGILKNFSFCFVKSADRAEYEKFNKK